MIKCPYCGKSHYEEGMTTSTCVYFQPIWKDGVNINPDKNIHTTECKCLECGKSFLIENGVAFKSKIEEIKENLSKQPITYSGDLTPSITPIYPMYQMVADENELRWFFEHVVEKPMVNESYTAVFVSRHKKLTKEEQKTIGLTRAESEFLSTQTFRLAKFKEQSSIDDDTNWTFENFLKRIRRFNVDKYAYTTALGEPIPEKTLAIIFYVNPCDEIKVADELMETIQKTKTGIVKAMLNGKSTVDNLHEYQLFGNLENNLKHFKAHCKGSRYWMDFDIDVPKWFKAGEHTYMKKSFLHSAFEPNDPSEINFTDSHGKGFLVLDAEFDKNYHDVERTHKLVGVVNTGEVREFKINYFEKLKEELTKTFGKGNYVIVDTSGGYHILVKTTSIKSNPHDFCKEVNHIYNTGVRWGEEEYLDDKGNLKFECIVNDSQIPGIPLPGTFQYGRPVTVLNKEDFE